MKLRRAGGYRPQKNTRTFSILPKGARRPQDAPRVYLVDRGVVAFVPPGFGAFAFATALREGMR